MKELSIEEKAKRYDEILARAKGANIPYYKEDIMSKVKEFVDYLIPELTQSEDERIRKEMITFFENYHDPILSSNRRKDTWLAWLEKQGEQKAKYHDVCDKCVRQSTCQSDCFLQQDEQKNDWSEEDARMLGKCIEAASGYYSPEDKQRMKDWLRAIKYRVHPQPKQEILEKLEEWLDEYVSDLADVDTASLICSFTNYLDGKLPKSLRPHSQWKPSDEQMKALWEVYKGGEEQAALASLYSDLKEIKD